VIWGSEVVPDGIFLQVPPAGMGNRTPARFPSRSGGNLKEGGKIGTFEHPLTPLDMPPR